MKFPKINKQPKRTVGMPKLSGGVNLRDAVTLVNDNQLTACQNMWYKDGILKTRPGLSTNPNMKYDVFLKYEECDGKPLDIYMSKNGLIYRLYQFRASGSANSTLSDGSPCEVSASHNGFFWVSRVNIIPLPEINDGGISFATQFKNKIYVYTTNRNIYTMVIDPEENNPQWLKVTEDEIYKPLILTHCKPTGKPRPSQGELLENGAVMFEGYNLLGNYYRMQWSTYNNSIAYQTSESDSTRMHTMVYGLLHSVKDFPGKTVTAKITNKYGTVYTHSLTIQDVSGWQFETTDRGDDIYLAVFGTMLAFVSSPGQLSYARVTENDYVRDNMEITAPCPNDAKNLEKVFGMRQAIWFGGDALGISGGTRLFLGGNVNAGEESLVQWSGLNKPTYFPENGYAYVGNSTQRVTAFGRQSDTLVIFKEREIFYTQYTRNANITADNLINQSVVDYTASNVYFPMIQLHSTIGCDCPNTVQLCRNFLVWANSDGNVYTLRSENQYSERNIYCVSDMVSRSLKECDIKNAYSADFDGHYFLFCGGRAYVMNYESYGYVYANSYNKTDDAQLMIPWWIWDIPYDADYLWNKGVFVVADNLFVVLYNADGYISKFYACIFSEYTDYDEDPDGNKTTITSSFTTKIFDFSSPHTNKNVPLVNINFGNNGGVPIKVSFITEQVVECGETVILSESNDDEYSPEYVHNRQFHPCVRPINRIGVKADSDGRMSVNSISIDYRLLGGAK